MPYIHCERYAADPRTYREDISGQQGEQEKYSPSGDGGYSRNSGNSASKKAIMASTAPLFDCV
jgi:hypothetical protein